MAGGEMCKRSAGRSESSAEGPNQEPARAIIDALRRKPRRRDDVAAFAAELEKERAGLLAAASFARLTESHHFGRELAVTDQWIRRAHDHQCWRQPREVCIERRDEGIATHGLARSAGNALEEGGQTRAVQDQGLSRGRSHGGRGGEVEAAEEKDDPFQPIKVPTSRSAPKRRSHRKMSARRFAVKQDV